MPKNATKGSFIKGDKRAGRTKGAENKTTIETKEFITDLLKGQHDNIITALNEVYTDSKNNYLINIAKLLPFVLPKNVDLTTNGKDIENKVNIPLIEWTKTNENKD